jgi:SAM-dependent methyltransferase
MFQVEGLAAPIVACPECGLGQFAPRLEADQIRRFYPDEYYGSTGKKFEWAVEWLVRFVAARQARFLSRGLPAGARVLDVGCGRGVMLRAFADRGFEVHGTEISPVAAQGVDPRATLHVAPSLREARLPEQAFDEVVLWHVFEHLPDPCETLEEIRRMLKPGGRVVIAVPNFSSLQARWTGPGWFHLDPPRHLFHYPISALRRLLEQHGFCCVSEHHFSLRQNPFGWVQSLLNLCPALPRNGLYVMLHRNHACRKPFTRPVRWAFRAAFLCGMPVALVLSVIAAVLRQGATVSIVATLPAGSQCPAGSVTAQDGA